VLNHVFTTPILRDTADLKPEQLGEMRDYLLELRRQMPGEAKSNRGGWHSTGNLFSNEFSQFPAVRDAITRALFAYIAEVFGYRGQIQLAITAWSVINGPGAYNVPHNHAANLLSGALYVTIPPGMQGGAIVFQDPRLNLNAHDTEGMRKLGIRPPWATTSINVPPVSGEILIFPSWLIHFVEPFQADDPDALRIVISFNASV
jgi:uncharacterized protein (TIGR02466 family)